MARFKIKQRKLKKLQDHELEILEFINEESNDSFDTELFILSMGYSNFSDLPKIIKRVIKSMIREYYDEFEYEELEYLYSHGLLYPRDFPDVNICRSVRNKIAWRILCEKYVDYDNMSDTLLSTSGTYSDDTLITPIGADFASESRFERMLAAKSDPELCCMNRDVYCGDISNSTESKYSIPDYYESSTNTHDIEFDTSSVPFVKDMNMRVVNGKARYLDITLF